MASDCGFGWVSQAIVTKNKTDQPIIYTRISKLYQLLLV